MTRPFWVLAQRCRLLWLCAPTSLLSCNLCLVGLGEGGCCRLDSHLYHRRSPRRVTPLRTLTLEKLTKAFALEGRWQRADGF
ncbi:MAG: hypothetical protein F6K36_28200 [Symploca sp. SIO3C6]|uniref:Secreted protein n=1 Tax=Symploca sp. SIO1C4 TaxID=2607765 RepID=A0A6B3NAJ4_9CYAN|nr:hypothetical protein [Symploca sp. SIO3C6]NER26651.1 hypothetical protein [Symploca sp. SIO1C4]NET08065.1 hypothetical protein [Symploca sp. SIO2B6]